jgi:hypothetical protein
MHYLSERNAAAEETISRLQTEVGIAHAAA